MEARSGLILVVEDDPGIREAITECLSGEGLRVAAASDGAEGLERFREERPDVVIVDLVMPVMSGAIFVEKLRAMAGENPPPIVLMTAAAPTAQPLPAVDEILPKPFALADLLEMVERHLGTQRPPPAA